MYVFLSHHFGDENLDNRKLDEQNIIESVIILLGLFLITFMPRNFQYRFSSVTKKATSGSFST